MSYSFHPEARREFEQAIDYYENREAGLGFDFASQGGTGRSSRPSSWLTMDSEG